ncbi:putative protein MIZU-KUSSEI 1-like [Capsicum annuum]|nr:putative protein MIZU-KUSSEI 1-like [Capsicum annuum]
MEPIITQNSKFQTYLKASEYFLQQKDFQECRKYAIKANEIEPTHSIPSQIRVIAEVLMHSNTINEHPNYYSVLKVPNYTHDYQVILNSFKNATELLNPNVNRYPLASEAFRVVVRAWSVLSNQIQKNRFDDELRKMEKGGRFFDPTRKSCLGDGGRSFWNPTQMTRFDNGLKSGSFFGPNQTRLDDGLKTNDNGGSFSNTTQKTRIDDGGGSSLNPTPKTHIDDGLKTNEKGGTFSNPTWKTRLDTFWTMCPYCYNVYEFLKDYEDCSLRCQNEKCRRVLHALPIVGPPPPPEVAENGEYYCFGFSVLGTEGKSLWSPFVMNKKNDDTCIEISNDEVEDRNGTKEESLGVEDELIDANGDEKNEGCTSFETKRIKMMAKSVNKVLGKGNKVNMNEIVYNVEGNDNFDFANVVGEKTNENNNVEGNDNDFDIGNVGGEITNENNNVEGNGDFGFGQNTYDDNIEFFMGDDDDDITVHLQEHLDMGAQDIGTLFT